MPTAPDMRQLLQEMCGLAERVAEQGFGTRLDYTNESIPHVEQILGGLHDDFRETGSHDGLRGIALGFGAYLVAVIERHYGTIDWQRDHPDFGKDSFPLYWNGTTLFPVSWCWKRMIDGPGDDLRSKWQALVRNHGNS